MHLDFTFGGLGLGFLDICPIKALLEGFTPRSELCELYSWSFFPLMWPDKWLQYI